MTWALINADNSWASGPLADQPTPANGQRVVEVALGYPDKCLWSPAKAGFVDVAAAAELTSKGRFKLLFTQAERIAMRTAAKQSPVVEDLMDLLDAFQDGVNLADPMMVDAIGQMQAAGLLTADRAAAVLAGTPPK